MISLTSVLKCLILKLPHPLFICAYLHIYIRYELTMFVNENYWLGLGLWTKYCIHTHTFARYIIYMLTCNKQNINIYRTEQQEGTYTGERQDYIQSNLL